MSLTCYRCGHSHIEEGCIKCPCPVHLDAEDMNAGNDTICSTCSHVYSMHKFIPSTTDCVACMHIGNNCKGFSVKPTKKEIPIKIGYEFILTSSKRYGKVVKIDGNDVTIHLETMARDGTITLPWPELEANSRSTDPITKYLIQPK